MGHLTLGSLNLSQLAFWSLLTGHEAADNKSFLDVGLGGTLLSASYQSLTGLGIGGYELKNKVFLEEMKLKLER